jgi:hypothetical protein
MLMDIPNYAMEIIEEISEAKGELTDSVTAFWTDTFDAGYKAGMVDIMAAMTFNKAGITAVKYLEKCVNTYLARRVFTLRGCPFLGIMEPLR